MGDLLCIRCQHPVSLEDGHLTYCSYCGAPQIFLSEELQASLAQGAREYRERTNPPPPESVPDAPLPNASRWPFLHPPGDPGRQQPWPLGVQYALLSAAVALALGLLSLLLPSASILMLLWVVSAPILTVAFFNARFSGGLPTTSGFAARLGLLTGLLMAICCAVVFTLSLVLTRFVFHDAGLLDAQLAASYAQQRAVVLQRLGTSVQPTLDILAVPEYRVGVLLSMLATSTVLYLLLSTIAAGVAGLVLRRRRGA